MEMNSSRRALDDPRTPSYAEIADNMKRPDYLSIFETLFLDVSPTFAELVHRSSGRHKTSRLVTELRIREFLLLRVGRHVR